MINTVSMVHAPSKEFKHSEYINDIPSGTIAYDGPAWFSIKVAEGCVVLPNSDYWLPKLGFQDPIDNYSGAYCTNSPYPTGTVVILTQE